MVNKQKAKAIVATIELGKIELEGLMKPNGEYRCGVSQIPKIIPNSVRPNQASRTLKRNLGEDFQFDQVASELNPKKVNAITLSQLIEVITWAAFSKNDQDAQKIAKALMIEPLERRFDKAFDRVKSERAYNERFEQRSKGKEVRWYLVDSVQDYIIRHKIKGNKATFYYKHVTDKIYEGLTGYKSTKKVREKYDVPSKETIRDYCSSHDLKSIENIEFTAQRLIDDYDIEPCEAVNKAVDRLLVRNIGLKRKSRL